MKRYLITFLMLVSSLFLWAANPNFLRSRHTGPGRCSIKKDNKRIFLNGYVRVVDANADLQIKVVNPSDSPDLVVEILPSGSSSSYCGEWTFWKETMNFSYDFTIQYVDSLPDLTIAWAPPKPTPEPYYQPAPEPSPRFGTINTSNCTYTNRWGKTVPLYGRVEVVSMGADFTVEVVNGGSSDLEVEETYPAHSCGQWEFVSMAADFTIEFVHMAADVKVKFVNSSPGFR